MLNDYLKANLSYLFGKTIVIDGFLLYLREIISGMVKPKSYFQMLPALHGDAILIHLYDENEQPKNIIIDMGTSSAYKLYIRPFIEKIRDKGEFVDLLICSHIDNDHINGILAFTRDEKIGKLIVKEWWLNYGDHVKLPNKSTLIAHKEGEKLSSYIENNSLNSNSGMIESLKNFADPTVSFYKRLGARITILSPTNPWVEHLEEFRKKNLNLGTKGNDYSVSIENLALRKEKIERPSKSKPTNIASIAFLLEVGSTRILFTADAHPDILLETIGDLKGKRRDLFEDGRLKIDYCQVPHHGSKKNTSYAFLNAIQCNKFFISTNGKSHNHPHKETLARILHPSENRSREIENEPITFYFNYPNKIFKQEEFEAYNFSCNFPENNKSGSTMIPII